MVFSGYITLIFNRCYKLMYHHVPDIKRYRRYNMKEINSIEV